MDSVTQVLVSECSSPPTPPDLPVTTTLLSMTSSATTLMWWRGWMDSQSALFHSWMKSEWEPIFSNGGKCIWCKFVNRTATRLRVRIDPAHFTGDPISPSLATYSWPVVERAVPAQWWTHKLCSWHSYVTYHDVVYTLTAYIFCIHSFRYIYIYILAPDYMSVCI